MKANTIQLKQMNVELIRTSLKLRDWSTKNSLAKETGLSVASCGNILTELLASGEIKEIDYAESTGGRRSRRFVYNKDFSHALLLALRREGDIHFIHSAVIDALGQIVEQRSRGYKALDLACVDDEVLYWMKQFSNYESISVGIPGVVQGGIIGQCDIPFFSGLNLMEHFEAKWQIPCVVENDVNAAAIGYYHRHSNAPEGLVYLYYPAHGNAGAGIIINGKVLRGFSHFAGEVAYLPTGIPFENQGQLQLDPPEFLKLLKKTVLTIVSLINPEYLILSGFPFSGELKDKLRQKLKKTPVGDFLPSLIFEEDIQESYLKGLSYLALEKQSCPFELVHK